MKTFEQYTEPKWIKFVLYEQKPKTKVYNIFTKDDDIYLGQIKWFPRWRCYSFYPENNTIFEKNCLQDIINFINKITYEKNYDKKN